MPILSNLVGHHAANVLIPEPIIANQCIEVSFHQILSWKEWNAIADTSGREIGGIANRTCDGIAHFCLEAVKKKPQWHDGYNGFVDIDFEQFGTFPRRSLVPNPDAGDYSNYLIRSFIESGGDLDAWIPFVRSLRARICDRISRAAGEQVSVGFYAVCGVPPHWAPQSLGSKRRFTDWCLAMGPAPEGARGGIDPGIGLNVMDVYRAPTLTRSQWFDWTRMQRLHGKTEVFELRLLQKDAGAFWPAEELAWMLAKLSNETVLLWEFINTPELAAEATRVLATTAQMLRAKATR